MQDEAPEGIRAVFIALRIHLVCGCLYIGLVELSRSDKLNAKRAKHALGNVTDHGRLVSGDGYAGNDVADAVEGVPLITIHHRAG